MEVLGINIPLWMVIVPVVLWLLYRYLTRTFDTFTKLGIPGPKPRPVTGTTHLLFKQGGIIEHDINIHKKYGKVVGVFSGSTPTLMINDAEFIKQIMVKEFSSFRNRQRFSKQKPLDKILSALKDEEWKYVRNHVSPTFSGQKLRRMMSILNKCSKKLVKNLSVPAKAGDAFECKEYMSSFTMDAIASTSFSIDIDSQNDKDNIFVRSAREFFDIEKKRLLLMILFIMPNIGPFLKYIGVEIFSQKAVDFFKDITAKAIKDREENPDETPNDFLQMMLAARVDDPDNPGNQKRQGLTEEEVLAQCILFFIAGYDNTSLSLGFTLFCLAKNPEYQERLYEEIIDVIGEDNDPDYDSLKKLTYLDMCFSEALRQYPVGFRNNRVANEAVTIQGINIPKGMAIEIPVYVLHHDPEAWPEPEIYDPERFTPEAKSSRHEYQYMPFGAGPRRCVAERLVLLQSKIILVHMIRAYKFVTCDKTPTEPVELKPMKMEAKNGMWLKVESRYIEVNIRKYRRKY